MESLKSFSSADAPDAAAHFALLQSENDRSLQRSKCHDRLSRRLPFRASLPWWLWNIWDLCVTWSAERIHQLTHSISSVRRALFPTWIRDDDDDDESPHFDRPQQQRNYLRLSRKHLQNTPSEREKERWKQIMRKAQCYAELLLIVEGRERREGIMLDRE